MDLMTSNARREKNVQDKDSYFLHLPIYHPTWKKWANLDNYHANTLGLAA